jgi:hypothetical protein
MKSSLTTATSCRIIRIPKAWEELGETTIQTISKQRTGGVTEKRDQPEWMTDGPSVGWFPDQRQIGMFLICSVPMVCPVRIKQIAW